MSISILEHKRLQVLEKELGARFLDLLNKSYRRKGVVVSLGRSILNPSLSTIRFRLSIFPNKDEDEVLLEIQKILPEMQAQLFRLSGLRKTPKIIVELDHSISEGDRILNLIGQIDKENDGEVQSEA